MNIALNLLASFLLMSFGLSASNSEKSSVLNQTNILHNNYKQSFIFIERGVEFAVFPDGQFDFYMPQYGPVNVSAIAPNAAITFNTGYNYNPYIQYDAYGAIIQIENIPIYYDYYGRVNLVGNVRIHYNNFGYVSRVGNLHIYYNPHHAFTHYTGYINVYNRHYSYRPWHNFYAPPAPNHCIVYSEPYRRYYSPKRTHFTTPYRNAIRPSSEVYNRRGDIISRNNIAVKNRGRSKTTITRKDYTSSSRSNPARNRNSAKNTTFSVRTPASQPNNTVTRTRIIKSANDDNRTANRVSYNTNRTSKGRNTTSNRR